MKKYFTLFLLLFFAFVGQAQIITTIAGNGTAGFSSDGIPATATELSAPYGVGMDSIANIYIGDAGNNKIRKINIAGIISTVAGIGTAGYSGDGGPATLAQLNFPYGMAVNRAGSIVIADMYNNRIRSIKSEFGDIIVTIGGNGTPGFSGDGGPATSAQIYYPQGIFWDAADNVYFGDHYNHRVRKIDHSGIITTIAGNGTPGFSGDGAAATAAELYYPSGVTMDATGNIYIADMYNMCIRKINTAGIISTVAGVGGVLGFSGDGGPATLANLRYPKDVFINSMGEIIISDPDNQRLRKISTSGIITTIAGTGVVGYSGDGSNATAAELNEPQGVYVDDHDNIYTGDCTNNRIRKIICLAPVVSSISGSGIDTICVDSTIILTDATIGGVWSSTNTHAAVVGTSGRVTGATVGTDTLNYSVSNVCSITKVSYPLYIKSCISTDIGLQNSAALIKMSIIPNPNYGSFTLSMPSAKHNTIITIYDILGKLILKRVCNSKNGIDEQFNLRNVSKGLYFINAYSEDFNYTEKIVIR